MRFPNGYGSIINLGKKRRKPFAVRITTGVEEFINKDGVKSYRQKYKYLGYFEKRKEALEFLALYNNKPQLVENKDITFNDIYEAWSKRKFEEIAKGTATQYKVVYNHCKELHNLPFSLIKVNQLQAIIDKHKNKGNINQFKTFFNMIYNYALKNEVVDKNYANFIEMPKRVKKHKKTPFSKDEINTLWLNKDKPYVNLILIQLYTGARISELLELTLDNINLNERYFYIAKSKTPAGVRFVPIHKDIFNFIKDAVESNKAYLFERKDKPFKYNYYLKNVFTPLMSKYNLNHTPHETRHTFISQCDRLTLNRIAVARIVGHTSNNITEHYTHKDINDLIEAIDKFYY